MDFNSIVASGGLQQRGVEEYCGNLYEATVVLSDTTCADCATYSRTYTNRFTCSLYANMTHDHRETNSSITILLTTVANCMMSVALAGSA